MSVPSVPVAPDMSAVDQEQSLVHDVYNDIAPHFSQTRYKPWPIVEKFLKGQPKYAIGLDVGCGNGKYLGVNQDVYMIGTDRSSGLIECAAGISNEYNLGIADGLHLPHENGRFDFAISIAVIHHFATPERRVEAIRHILSKLRVGGQALIYCWALEQETSRRGYKEGDDQDILVPWVLKQKREKKEKKEKKGRRRRPEGTKDTDSKDPESVTKEKEADKEDDKAGVQEQKEPEDPVKFRYYHLYKKGELSSNAQEAGGKIIEEGYEKDNWWVIVERV